VSQLEVVVDYGTLEQTMTILHTTKKLRMLNTIKKYYILEEAHHNNQLNNRATVMPNFIFNTLSQQDPNCGPTVKQRLTFPYLSLISIIILDTLQ
jgi:hypothetical protein